MREFLPTPKNYIRAMKLRLAKRCDIGVAYSIGIAQPASLYLVTFGTGITSNEDLLYLLKLY